MNSSVKWPFCDLSMGATFLSQVSSYVWMRTFNDPLVWKSGSNYNRKIDEKNGLLKLVIESFGLPLGFGELMAAGLCEWTRGRLETSQRWLLQSWSVSPVENWEKKEWLQAPPCQSAEFWFYRETGLGTPKSPFDLYLLQGWDIPSDAWDEIMRSFFIFFFMDPCGRG